MKFDNLTEKDKRTIKFGMIAVCLILGYAVFSKLTASYLETARSLKAARAKFKSVLPEKDGSPSRSQAGQYAIVPVFELPEKEVNPGAKFRGQFMTQLKKAGINFTSLNQRPMIKKRNPAGLGTLKYHCKGKCNFSQAVDLLAALYENPLFVGVEEFKIECNPKKRDEMELDLTVSTFIK